MTLVQLRQDDLEAFYRFRSVIEVRCKVFGGPIDSIACVGSHEGVQILVHRLGRRPAQSMQGEKREEEHTKDE